MMAASIPNIAVLTCHPGTWNQAVHEIEVSMGLTQDGALSLTYFLRGDVSRLRIPPCQPPRRADRLWEHTCFEAFVSVKGSPAYYEFNFAPSREWAAYMFSRYRDGSPFEDQDVAPGIDVQSTDDSLELRAVIRLDGLQIPRGSRLRLGLSAVVEDETGVLSCWALKHTAGKPDFHHPDAFALEVDTLDAVTVNESAIAKP